MKIIKPTSKNQINKFINLLKNKIPFSFIRFSDGEIEILRNRYLDINDGKTIFRGKEYTNLYPKYDAKTFNPIYHQSIRSDLLESALYRDDMFLKGIPTSHNGALIDREFLLRLNGGFGYNMTFSDLFLNSNYKIYQEKIVPLFSAYKNIYVVANFRAKLSGFLSQATHVPIPDNFFLTYNKTILSVMIELGKIENGSLVLASASSLSNIIAYKLFLKRRDITVIDVGTSINFLLSLDHNIRNYHDNSKNYFFNKRQKGFNIRW
jgi:hypothetical protein